MVALTHKAKQYGWYALKVSFVFIAVYIIYRHIDQENRQTLQSLIDYLQWRQLPWGFLFLGFATFNWFLESLKWQTVISAEQPISLSEAAHQSLASLTISLATPNRIGEYGAKVLFYPSKVRKKILVLTFFSNASQMLVTIIFGVIGGILIYPVVDSPLPLWILLGILGVVLIIGLLVIVSRREPIKIQNVSLGKALRYLKSLSRSIKVRTFIYSLLRYLIFSCHFFLLLQFFGAENTFIQTVPFIWMMYLCVSLIPMFTLFDVVVKGGVALWLFDFIEINEVVVLATVLCMWLFHFAIPALFGTLRVLKFNPQ